MKTRKQHGVCSWRGVLFGIVYPFISILKCTYQCDKSIACNMFEAIFYGHFINVIKFNLYKNRWVSIRIQIWFILQRWYYICIWEYDKFFNSNHSPFLYRLNQMLVKGPSKLESNVFFPLFNSVLTITIYVYVFL